MQKMDKREQKVVLEKFLTFHNVELLPHARLPHFARRFVAFFPEIAQAVNPERKPWKKSAVERLAHLVATIDPASVEKKPDARQPHIAKKYRNLNKTRAFLLSWDWRELRYEVLRERGAKCELCGATRDDERIEVDHILPISKHWHRRLDKTNLQILCRPCNSGKSNRHTDDFRASA
jgi:5-methylcytosine-specific restriction endonuclease McrA